MATQRADQYQECGIHPGAISQARASMLPDADLANLADTFSALADSNRVKILFALATTELCVSDLAAVVGISESAISQHLRILRSLRWVKGRREGRVISYSLEDRHVHELLAIELEHARGS